MSRHTIETPHGWPKHYHITFGWDAGLQTYFAQVIDRNDNSTMVWIGTIDVINSADDLERGLNAKLPSSLSPVSIDNDMKRRLETDRREESEESV